MDVTIEAAEPQDVAAILAIFNREIRDGTALWNTHERSEDEMRDWYEQRLAAGFPVLAAREGQRLLGYGSFGPFRPHDGYRHTVEHSLYIEPFAHRRGIGRAMLRTLEVEARARGVHVMIGGSDASNAGSIALHVSEGFTETARLREVGRKFDRWLTLVLMQKVLT
ncbi:MAG: N-acetyltransferase family protein [Pseudomonadota bacterium]